MESPHCFINSAFSRETERVPVWLMRQAGRYMKEYRDMRAKYSFLEMCKTKELACKVTMLPIDLLDVDVAILFSDILIVLEAMGLDIGFTDKGPVIYNKIRTMADIKALPSLSVYEKIPFVMDSIALVKKELNGRKPLIGFAGAPFTLMSYIIEQGSSPDLKTTKRWINENPSLAHSLLSKITEKTIEYLNAQIKAGAEAVQIFDTWAGLLSYDNFANFSLKYLNDVIVGLKRDNIPVILFAKGLGMSYLDLLTLDIDVISVDWSVDIVRLKDYIKDSNYKIAVQGNFDPYLLYLPKDKIKESVKRLLYSIKDYRGYIFNLGHGVMPDIPFENVRCLVDTVKELGIYAKS